MDEAGIMSVQHIVGGILAGFICFGFQKGYFGIANEVIGVIISLVLVYLLGKHAEKKYGRETIGLNSWVMNGIVPFYFVCMVVWILLLNYIV
ncbi:MAG: hypothetical protein BZ137_02635 [Methanosphaera sp. rholeuAM130]|nr:hypothetical protein [Methanosphaera sp.]RAP54355.1 MAG: hypothetical protein BZ137_02635 [Methanosphaera sp. rholeuAM130]